MELKPGSSNHNKQNSSMASVEGFSNIVNTEGMSQELLHTLECPACHQINPPPIFLCVSGHSVCKRCRYNLNACPKCLGGFSNMRNELAESFISKLRIKCPNYKYGCTFDSAGGAMLPSHETTCEYAVIACKVSSNVGCGKPISILDYDQHVITEHNISGMESTQAVISMSTSVRLGQSNWTFPPHYLKAFGKTFYCYVHASFNILLLWVSLCGIRDELKNYVASITIFDPKKKLMQAKWIGPIHSYLTVPKDVYDSGNCLALLPETFILFTEMYIDEKKRRIKKWKCHFEIIEVGPEESTPEPLGEEGEEGNTTGENTNSVLESAAAAELRKNNFWDTKDGADFTNRQ